MPDLDDEKMLKIARAAMTDETPVPVTISVANLWFLVSALQFTVRMAATGDAFKDRLKNIAKQFQGAIEDAHPQVTRILNMGWDSAYDVPNAPAVPPATAEGEKPPLKEVINAFAIYWDDSPAQKHFCELRRPQDWGDPRWMYRKYALEALGCHHEAHCYVEHQMSDLEHLNLFTGCLCMIAQTYPPTRREMCDRSHLREDDFWQEAWGPMPPHFDEDDEYGNDFDGEF